MARIVYGVSGEGSGHSSRAREMLTHLLGRGHTVKVVSYDRGYRNLEGDFDVFETEGLSIATVDNKVSVVRTFTENLAKLSEGIKKLRELRHVAFKDFEPDAVITDFEPMTAYLADHYDVPLISLDNQHRMRYMRYECPPELRTDARTTETVIRLMVPRPDASLVTTFWFGETKNERTFLFPPILRQEVRQLEPTAGAAAGILVYFTKGNDPVLELLRAFPRERFVVYGYDKSEEDGNLVFRPFSREGFLADLARARAVIATAGFTLMTESLFLRKPYLALPMAGQFEQELNGLLLAAGGWGKNVRNPGVEAIGDFLYRLPEYRARLDEYDAGDPAAITGKLDELLAADGQRVKAMKREH
ncbi:MAG: hypothetical protein GY711_30290 [bacterium]|nr:hypothetical protein [bacterium]